MSGSLMILGCFVLGVLLAWLGWIPTIFWSTTARSTCSMC